MTILEANARTDQRDDSAVESLIERARGGDVDAFGELVSQYRQQVVVYLIGMIGEPSAADEIAQDVFVAAFQSIDRFKAQGRFSTWLMGIARNKALSSLRESIARSRRERMVGLQRLEQWRSQRAETTDETLWNEQLEALHRCLQKLTPEQQRLLSRYYQNNESAESIAQDTGRSGSGIRMLFLRLRKTLFHCIQRDQASANGPTRKG